MDEKAISQAAAQKQKRGKRSAISCLAESSVTDILAHPEKYGLVKVSDNQELPEIDPNSNDDWQFGYRAGQKDMLTAGWMKVEKK